MSRIGKLPISVPNGVTIEVSKSNLVTVKGPKGELTEQIDQDLGVSFDNGELTVSRPTNQKRHRSMHGLYRSLLANMVTGVNEGYVRELELEGVGYRVNNIGNLMEINVGYSHPIYFSVPDEIALETKMEKGKKPSIRLEGFNKQLIGQIAAKIRSFRPPEPYKGKGIMYKGEILRRKTGKAAG